MGATICFFPIDEKALEYMRLTGRNDDQVAYTKAYLQAQNMFRDYNDASQDCTYTEVLEVRSKSRYKKLERKPFDPKITSGIPVQGYSSELEDFGLSAGSSDSIASVFDNNIVMQKY